MGEPGDYLLSQEIQLTIIGVEAFHCPVRDGKEWDHPALASGLNLSFPDGNQFGTKSFGDGSTASIFYLSVSCFFRFLCM